MTRDSQRIKKLSRVRFLFSLADARTPLPSGPRGPGRQGELKITRPPAALGDMEEESEVQRSGETTTDGWQRHSRNPSVGRLSIAPLRFAHQFLVFCRKVAKGELTLITFRQKTPAKRREEIGGERRRANLGSSRSLERKRELKMRDRETAWRPEPRFTR